MATTVCWWRAYPIGSPLSGDLGGAAPGHTPLHPQRDPARPVAAGWRGARRAGAGVVLWHRGGQGPYQEAVVDDVREVAVQAQRDAATGQQLTDPDVAPGKPNQAGGVDLSAVEVYPWAASASSRTRMGTRGRCTSLSTEARGAVDRFATLCATPEARRTPEGVDVGHSQPRREVRAAVEWWKLADARAHRLGSPSRRRRRCRVRLPGWLRRRAAPYPACGEDSWSSIRTTVFPSGSATVNIGGA
jgi:hypothetical protein